MKWEIGKTYETRRGESRRLVAITPEGRLIVESPRGWLSYRSPTGEYFLESGARITECFHVDLINPDEPTDEEREKIAKVLGALSSVYGSCVRSGTYAEVSAVAACVARFLEVLREGR